MADAPSVFGNERAALVRDLRGNVPAAVALEHLVVAYLRGDRDGRRFFQNPFMDGPEIAAMPVGSTRRRTRQEFAAARRALELVRRSFGAVDRVGALTRELLSTLDQFEALTVPPPGRRGRPKMLQRWWLCCAAVVALRSNGVNYRPARFSRLEGVLEKVCRAAQLPVPNDMYAVLKEAVDYGDAWIRAAERRAAQPEAWPLVKAIVKDRRARGFVIEPDTRDRRVRRRGNRCEIIESVRRGDPRGEHLEPLAQLLIIPRRK